MKEVKDFIIVSNNHLSDCYTRMELAPADGSMLPAIFPGQFVQIAVDAPGVFLRRPISVNDVNKTANTLTLLIRHAGKGTERLLEMESGERLNILLPLGNGFTVDIDKKKRILLIGGGVGVAPLLYLGRILKEKGMTPEFLLGARSKTDLLEKDDFEAIGKVHVCTEDGSEGVKGFVTAHPVLDSGIDMIYCCGPTPMMKAVAAIARSKVIECELSLENMMACGLGACLCCVEKTVKGNVCVCTEGPVFNLNLLNL